MKYYCPALGRLQKCDLILFDIVGKTRVFRPAFALPKWRSLLPGRGVLGTSNNIYYM